MGVSQFKPPQPAPAPQQGHLQKGQLQGGHPQSGHPQGGHAQSGQGPQQVNPAAGQSPRWEFGIDRNQVAAFIGVALIAGFGFGYLAARYLSQGRDTTEKARASARPSPGDSGQGADSRATSDGDWHKVNRIIRADMIELDGVGGIRLMGVNAPGSQSLEGNKALADEAMKFTTETLLGKEVRIELEPGMPGGGKDEAGNTFAYVYTRDGALFNEEMIRRGDAFAKVDQPSKFVDRFRAAEREAMEKSTGVWSPTDKLGKGGLLGSTGDKGSRPGLTGKLPDPLPSSIPPTLLDPRTPGSVVTEPMIYVSGSDRMYHKQGCEYLGKKGRPMLLSEAKAAGYVACGRCFASTVMKAP